MGGFGDRRRGRVVALACVAACHSGGASRLDGQPDVAAADDANGSDAVAVVNSCALTIPALGSCPVGLACMADVPYRTVGATTLTFDLARPAGGGPYPFVLLIHGGGFVAGDKADRRLDAVVLAQHGYVAATINYRLMSATGPVTDPFPAQIQDVRCAVRFFRANASTYAIDPAHVAAMGTSAGAVLTGMLGTESDVTSLDDATCTDAAQPVAVQAIVPVYGAFDLRPSAPPSPDATINALIDRYTHRPPDDPTIDDEASSIVHVDPTDPPVLLLHGTADAEIPISQSQAMLASLHDMNVPATLVTETGAAHGFEPFQTSQPYLTGACTTLAFLQKWL